MADISQVILMSGEDRERSVWNALRRLLDSDYCERVIRARHSLPLDISKSNIRKQAAQVSQSLRQAEAYFKSANSANLAVRPNILYYGAASLARVLILLAKDGNSSVDKLRKDERHRHHGLALAVLANRLQKASIPEFFSSLRVSVHTNRGKPWGHFALYYESLVRPAVAVKLSKRKPGLPVVVQAPDVLAACDIPEVAEIVQAPQSLDALALELPELYWDLHSAGIHARLARMKFDSSATYKDQGRAQRVAEVRISGLVPETKTILKNWVSSNQPDAAFPSDLPGHLHIRYSEAAFEADQVFLLDCTQSIDGKVFAYTGADIHIPEPVNWYMVLFGLGMLCRYYPDIWMACLDSNPALADFLEILLDAARVKLPLLFLDQCLLSKHSFA